MIILITDNVHVTIVEIIIELNNSAIRWIPRLCYAATILLQENGIEVSHNGRKYYLTCVTRVNSDETLCIGATFARSLNIQEGDEVLVSSLKSVPSLSSVKIAPRTASDRELLVGHKFSYIIPTYANDELTDRSSAFGGRNCKWRGCNRVS